MSFENVSGTTEAFDYVVEKTLNRGGEETMERNTSLQLNFVCDVSEEVFKVDPNEHSEGVWATKADAQGLDMTSQMRLVVENAFRWKEGVVSAVS